MYTFSTRLEVSNSRKTPHVVVVEPWANDYTLLPDEELVIEVFDNNEMPWFHVREWDGTTQVYVQTGSDFRVKQGSHELECGHNRQTTT